MCDAFAVRGVEGIADLGGVTERLIEWQRARLCLRDDRRALDEFHHQIIRTNVMQGADIGMIQRRDRAGEPVDPGCGLKSESATFLQYRQLLSEWPDGAGSVPGRHR